MSMVLLPKIVVLLFREHGTVTDAPALGRKSNAMRGHHHTPYLTLEGRLWILVLWKRAVNVHEHNAKDVVCHAGLPTNDGGRLLRGPH